MPQVEDLARLLLNTLAMGVFVGAVLRLLGRI